MNCKIIKISFSFLGIIDDKYIGILALLNNESKMPNPSDENFTINVHNSWKSSTILTVPQKKNIEDGFTIRHFAGNVSYDSVNIIINLLYSFFLTVISIAFNIVVPPSYDGEYK